jgi:hypothetical protein
MSMLTPSSNRTDTDLKAWWPDLGTLVAELRQSDQPAVADLLVDAVRAGATSGEILDGIGVVLREHRSLRSQLSDAGDSNWDSVMADVDRAYPGSRIGHWFARLIRRRT